MAQRAVNLSDEDRFALMKLRRNCLDCKKSHHDDHFYLRWLFARDFNVEAAEKMLRDSLKWREEWQIDSILSWKPPEHVMEYYPSGLSGFDKEGSPVVIIPFAGLDIWGMLHSVKKSDFIRMTLQKIEHYVELGQEQAKRHGQQAAQVCVLIDMENFNLRQYTWRPAGEVIITLVQMYEAHYPEILKWCFIVNAPKIFAFAFSIVKKFMKEYTIRKIQIHKNEPEKWQPLLLKFIDADQLPKYFGGTMVDPDGNAKCLSKINQGGTIPKSLYYKKSDKLALQDDKFTQVVVKKGEKLQISLISTDDGSILRWEFRTEGHDIKFGVTCEDADGRESVAVPLQRVTCYPTPDVGEIRCQSPATYTITFDNTHSFLRNKTLHYSLEMKTPQTDGELNEPQDVPANMNSDVISKT